MSMIGLVSAEPRHTFWCRLRRHERRTTYVWVTPVLSARVTFCATCRGKELAEPLIENESFEMTTDGWSAPPPPRPAPPHQTEHRGG